MHIRVWAGCDSLEKRPDLTNRGSITIDIIELLLGFLALVGFALAIRGVSGTVFSLHFGRYDLLALSCSTLVVYRLLRR